MFILDLKYVLFHAYDGNLVPPIDAYDDNLVLHQIFEPILHLYHSNSRSHIH